MSIHYANGAMSNLYVPLWSKYRPAILQMMIASAQGPQQYKLFNHEFRIIDPKEKDYSFALKISNGTSGNNWKSPNVSQDLLRVLEASRKASELFASDSYEFVLDKKFVFHVTRVPEPQE
jgi:hypothetical protein